MAKGQQGQGQKPQTPVTPAAPVAHAPVAPVAPVAAAAAPVAPAAPAKPLTAMEVVNQKVTVLEARVFNLEKFIAEGGAAPKAPKAKFGGKRGATPTKDTQTGLLYESKSAVGKALAAENGLDPDDHYVWYELIKRFPGRFVDCNEQESAIVLQRRDERIAKEIAEANAKLEAEAAAANAAAAKAQK